MLSKFKIALWGIVAAILTQSLISLAETWSFGPSLKPLQLIFGWLTFPVVTAVTLGVPVAAVYFAASRLAKLASAQDTALLVLPFGLLQLLPLAEGSLNFYTVFYPLSFVVTAVLGAALCRLRWPAARGQ